MALFVLSALAAVLTANAQRIVPRLLLSSYSYFIVFLYWWFTYWYILLLLLVFSLVQAQEALERFSMGPSESVLVVDGRVLSLFLSHFPKYFILSACQAPAVVCCRCSPTQKAAVVSLLKLYTDRRTCAVGDGGNDVSMIQAAVSPSADADAATIVDAEATAVAAAVLCTAACLAAAVLYSWASCCRCRH